MIRTIVLIFGALVGLFFVMLGYNISLWLLSQPNDIAVVLGVLLFLFLTLGGIFTVVHFARRLKVQDWKKFLPLILVALCMPMFNTGCATRIGPGHVGIYVKAAGTDKGVLDTPVQTGMVWYNPITASVIEYPTFIQTAKWTRDTSEGKPIDESVTFTNKDSMVVNADISLSYSLIAQDVPKFYVKFKVSELDQFTHGFLRNVARDCLNEHAGKYSIEEIMGDNGKFLKEARDCIQNEMSPYGVRMEQFGFIGAPRPPQSVIDQINQKVQAQQIALRTEMELATTKAQAAKNIAEAEGNAKALLTQREWEAKAQIAQAEGEAKANQIRNSSITPALLRMRELDNANTAIQKWDGVMPSVMTGDKGSSFLMQIPQKGNNEQ